DDIIDVQAGSHYQQLRSVQCIDFVEVDGWGRERGVLGCGGWRARRGLTRFKVTDVLLDWYYSDSSRNAVSCDLDIAPTFVAAALPSLKSISVGMQRMPNLAAVSGFSSTLSLAMITRPSYALAASSSRGAIILQGPHHSAQ